MLEKLKTKEGLSSIGVILIISFALIFMCLPVFAVLVDRGLLRLAAQDIVDEIDSEMFLLYQHINIQSLSEREITLSDDFIDELNSAIAFDNPTIHNVLISDVQLEKNSEYEMTFFIDLALKPTLYRQFYDLDEVNHFEYTVSLPLN